MSADVPQMTDEQRDMTASELRWWRTLKAHLRRMPKNVELNARYDGSLGIAPAGSNRASCERRGDADDIYADEWDSIRGLRLDGRDSHI